MDFKHEVLAATLELTRAQPLKCTGRRQRFKAQAQTVKLSLQQVLYPLCGDDLPRANDANPIANSLHLRKDMGGEESRPSIVSGFTHQLEHHLLNQGIKAGALYAHVRVSVPAQPSDEERALYERLADLL